MPGVWEVPMRSVHSLCFLAVSVAGLLHAASASAQLVDTSAGVKGFLGGNVYSTPSNPPLKATGVAEDGLGFTANGGGFGWGGGVYVEARLIKFIGLEIDGIYDKSQLYRDVTYNNVVKVREKVTSTNLRIPLLAKGILPVPFGRLSIFLGPEFIVPLSASASNEITTGEQLLAANNAAEVKAAIKAKTAGSTMLTMGLGLTIELPASLELPIELRASKNMSQPDNWNERVVDVTSQPQSYRVIAQNSWDFRLGLGLGYKF
jgi:hypothetical protein